MKSGCPVYCGTKRFCRSAKSGGALLGLIVAMVVVGVISAGIVKMLRGQAATSSSAYNVMRARYAAEAGINYIRTVDRAAWVVGTYTLPNDDQFEVVSLVSNAAASHVTVTIRGTMFSGNAAVADRLLTAVFPLGGGGGGTGEPIETTPGDALVDNVLIDEVPDPTAHNDHLHLDRMDKDFVPKKRKGKKSKKDIDKVYERVLLSHDVFRTETLNTPFGQSLKLRTDLDIRHAEVEYEGGTKKTDKHLIWDVLLPLDFSQQAGVSAAGGLLKYDAQVKISWEEQNRSFTTPYSRIYGAQGIAFKVHGISGERSFYALTLMRYADAAEKNNRIEFYDEMLTTDWATGLGLPGYNSTDGYWGSTDCISNRIKPPGMQDKYLLVLWKETSARVAAGKKNKYEIEKTRTWVAYRTVNTSYLRSNKFVLDVGLYVRAEEGVDENGKYFDVVMGMSDGGRFWMFSPFGNTNPFDQGWNSPRRTYLNASDLPDSFNTRFPKWITSDISTWNPDVDYFTLLGGSRAILNPSIDYASYLSDGATLRIYDADFLYENQAVPGGEIGLIFCGNFMSGMQHDLWDAKGKLKNKDPNKWSDELVEAADLPSLYMAVDDLAVLWGGGSPGDESGGEIVTDF